MSSHLIDMERAQIFQQISTERMGETNVKYCPLPSKKLGRGISATVFPGYHFGIRKPAAVKFIEKEYVDLEEGKEMKELLTWTKIDDNDNINIIRLYDSFNDIDNGMYLAMELAERTFKKQVLEFNPPETDVIKWLYQIASALGYLHGKGVIHRDIKPDNILMVKQDKNRLIAKLADFGVCKMLSSAEITSTFSNAHGTLLWMAPEALTNQNVRFKNTRKLDIYALGMVMYFGISKGSHPFFLQENEDVINKVVPRMISEKGKPNLSRISNLRAADLLEKMMQQRANDRPEILEVLSHCLFWDWKSEQQFLIKAATCLSRQGCPEIDRIKNQIDSEYSSYYQVKNLGKTFNWIRIAKENNFDMEELLFTSQPRKKLTTEYGNGDSVLKFMKLFRDKNLHYPDMKAEAADKFSENDGLFCEEKFVKFLTSICPGLLAILYGNLERHANEQNVIPLSKLYFPWTVENDSGASSQATKNISEKRQQIQCDILEAMEDDFPVVTEGFKKYGENISVYVPPAKRVVENVHVHAKKDLESKSKQDFDTSNQKKSEVGRSLKRDDDALDVEAMRRLQEKQGRDFTFGNF